MKITMIGHCTVLIETGKTEIITDPYFGLSGDLAYKRPIPPGKTRADLMDVNLVLISHNHWDHIDGRYLRSLTNGAPVVVPGRSKWVTRLHGAKNVVAIKAWESQCFGEITITAVPASHTTVAIGYVIQCEGKQVYFAGDTYYHPFMAEIGRQFRLDLALMPVTTYRIPMTMGEESAVRAVKALSPRVVIPIHLGIEPRLPLLRTNHTPAGFHRRVCEASLPTHVVILREGQNWEL